MIVAVLATGESLSQKVVDSIRGKCKVVAVSDAYLLAPWADVLVSSDAAWWRETKPEFDGPKYTLGIHPDVEKVKDIPMGTNSGLLGIHIAVTRLGATKVLGLGFDMHGTHFFGPHKKLKNTPPHRREQFHSQFANYKPRGVQILNCTPNSKLKCYPTARLEDALLVELEASGFGEGRSVQDRSEKTGLHRRDRDHDQTGQQGYALVMESNP